MNGEIVLERSMSIGRTFTESTSSIVLDQLIEMKKPLKGFWGLRHLLQVSESKLIKMTILVYLELLYIGHCPFGIISFHLIVLCSDN